MNLHLHSHDFWASHLAHISCTDPHAMTTAPSQGRSCFHLCHSSAKLHVSPHTLPSWDTTSFEGWPSGPHGGPWVLIGDRSIPGMGCVATPRGGFWHSRHTCPGGQSELQWCQKVPIPSSSHFPPPPPFPSLWFFFWSNYSRELLFL